MQMSAKPALIAATILAFYCAECDGRIETPQAKLGRPAIPAAIGAMKRKRSMLGDGVSTRKTGAHITSNFASGRRQVAAKHDQKTRLFTSVAHRKKPESHASQTKPSRKQIALLGLASFYSDDLETASGEQFDRRTLSAAHPSLPFGTRVRVTNVGNGRSVTVRINDRGPFVRGRIIDVTSAAAEVLGMINVGLARVSLDVVR